MPDPACDERCCCDTCKVCGWGLPDTLYVKVQNLTFPECEATSQIGCGVTGWLNDVTATFVSGPAEDLGSDDPCQQYVRCYVWTPADCGTPPPPTPDPCDLTDRNSGEGRLYLKCADSSVNMQLEPGCDCVADNRTTPQPTVEKYYSRVAIVCRRPGNYYRVTHNGYGVGAVNDCVAMPDTGKWPHSIGVLWGVASDTECAFIPPGCCWLWRDGPDPETGLYGYGEFTGIDMDYYAAPAGAFNDNGGSWIGAGAEAVVPESYVWSTDWDTDGPVCDEDGHFVSQTWTFTTTEGVSGEIVVYA